MFTNMSRHSTRHGHKSMPKLGGSAAIIGIVSAMAIIVPLLCGSSPLTSVGKVIAFEVLGAALACVLLVNINTNGLVRRFKENITAGPNLLVLAVVVSAVISFAIGSTNKGLTASELTRVLICATVYFGVMYNLRGRLTLVTDVIMGVAAAAAVFGLACVGDQGLHHGSGVVGSFGTHETLGSFLMLMLPITLAIGIFNKKDETRRVIALAVSLLVTVCLAFSQSRSGWISELVALGVMALLASKFYSTTTAGTKPRITLAAAILAFVGIAGIVVAVSGSGQGVLQRLASFDGASSGISMHDRFSLWHAALAMIAAKPFFGWGLGSFPYTVGNFTSTAVASAIVAKNGVNLLNIAHNYYLQLAAETGIVGLGMYVGMVVTFFTVGVRALGTLKDGTRKLILVGVLAAMAGQVVDAMTSPSYNVASVSMIQWLLMGIGMFAAGVPIQDEVTAPAAAVVRAPAASRLRIAMRVAVASMACLVVGVAMIGSTGSAVADSYHNDNQLTDTDGVLIGAGGLAGGYFVGQAYDSWHWHHIHHHDDGGTTSSTP